MNEELKIDTIDWSKITCGDDVSFFKPDYTIKFIFQKVNGTKVIGCLDFNEDKLKFEGDVEESAKIFMNYLLNVFNQRIKRLENEAYERGYQDGIMMAD
jgi:hypothetical protein